MKVYGPYTRKDGRQIVCIIVNNKQTTVSYPKYLIEQKLGRKLESNETIHHIDHNVTNNDISNLEIRERAEHSQHHATKVKLVKIYCVLCNKVAYKKPNYLHSNSKKGKAGPFCSRSCAGKYGAEIQNKRMERLESQPRVPISKRKYS